MSGPKVSILLPVHNGASYLKEALDSVWAQDFAEIELVVVDDASTDATSMMLDEESDPRLVRIRLDVHQGLANALNIGLKACQAPFVARLDSDDRCLPGRIRSQFDVLCARSGLLAVGTAALIVDSTGTEIGRRDAIVGSGAVLKRLRWRNALIHPSAMFRRDSVIAVGGYSNSAGGFEDYHLWLRLARAGELDNLDDALIQYRAHAGQATAFKVGESGPMRAILEARRGLANSRGESTVLAGTRHGVWMIAQWWGDRRRR